MLLLKPRWREKSLVVSTKWTYFILLVTQKANKPHCGDFGDHNCTLIDIKCP